MSSAAAKILRSVPRLLRGLPRLAHPSAVGVLLRNFFPQSPNPVLDTNAHLAATIDWLCRAQDYAGGRGVSAGYSLLDGWQPAYPETTGYIIPTFFDYAKRSGRDELRARALRMADWEIEIQLPTGAVLSGALRSGVANPKPAVFNTGQVIFGWCRAYQESKDARYLDAAIRAGNWLAEVQSEDGAWRVADPETETEAHAYDVRSAWSLLELNKLANRPEFLRAATKNVEWTLAQQKPNGWCEQNAFFYSQEKWSLPLTHTIAYVMEGLLGSGQLLGDAKCLRAVRQTADRLLQVWDERRFMPAEFDANWNSPSQYSCLTGSAQIAGVWLKLFAQTGDARYAGSARMLNHDVKATQSLSSTHPGIRGGVQGSWPIYGSYSRLTFINWGAKFLADSLMLELDSRESEKSAVSV